MRSRFDLPGLAARAADACWEKALLTPTNDPNEARDALLMKVLLMDGFTGSASLFAWIVSYTRRAGGTRSFRGRASGAAFQNSETNIGSGSSLPATVVQNQVLCILEP
jgi:hypothetical protein